MGVSTIARQIGGEIAEKIEKARNHAVPEA
jgi:hypothetical protein